MTPLAFKPNSSYYKTHFTVKSTSVYALITVVHHHLLFISE